MKGSYQLARQDIIQRDNRGRETRHIILERIDSQFRSLPSVISYHDEVMILCGVDGGYDVVWIAIDAFFAYFAYHFEPRLVLLHIISINMSDEMVGKTMHMSIKWQWSISFIFQSWTVPSYQIGFVILGLVLTVLVSGLSVALPAVKNRVVRRLFRRRYNSTLLIKEKDSVISDTDEEGDRAQSLGEHIFGFFYILAYSLMHIATMMLIMTYNGYVVIAVMLGLAIGFSLFGFECDKDKNVPVNCCA